MRDQYDVALLRKSLSEAYQSVIAKAERTGQDITDHDDPLAGNLKMRAARLSAQIDLLNWIGFTFDNADAILIAVGRISETRRLMGIEEAKP